MGTVMDLMRGSTHDYVDNPYWSVLQIKVKQMAYKDPVCIMDKDIGKVLLFVNMTLEDNMKMHTDEQLQDLQRVLKKYQGPNEKEA